MAVKVSVVVADWQAQEALDLVMGSRLLLCGEPEFEQVEEHPEDRITPLVYPEPQPPVEEEERPELERAALVVVVYPVREAV